MFDLDTACDNARARIKREINRSASRHLLELFRPADIKIISADVVQGTITRPEYDDRYGWIDKKARSGRVQAHLRVEGGAEWFWMAYQESTPIHIPELSENTWMVLGIVADALSNVQSQYITLEKMHHA